MIILAGTIRVAPGTRAEAITAIERMIEATRAEEGCIAYSFAFDVLDEHLLRIFEVFRDELALEAHRTSPHMAEWRAQLPLLGISDRNLSHYDVVSARQI